MRYFMNVSKLFLTRPQRRFLAVVPSENESKRLKTLVNIKGLPKEWVLISLFSNVYLKSEACVFAWQIAQLYYHDQKQIAPIGIYSSPMESQAREMLSKQPYIDSVGVVSFQIDFSFDEINTEAYDKIHRTGHDSEIIPASVCIDELRETIASEKEELDKAKVEGIAANRQLEESLGRIYYRSINQWQDPITAEQKALAEKQKKLDVKKARRKAADQQLRNILKNEDCSIEELGGMAIVYFYFESQESEEKLLIYANKLIKLGLPVEITEKSKLPLNDSATLLFLDPIDTIVRKLLESRSQSSVYNSQSPLFVSRQPDKDGARNNFHKSLSPFSRL